jgi:hypothetical protein
VRTRRINWQLKVKARSVLRIFMEGQEEWLEPCGGAMLVLAKLLAVCAVLAFSSAAYIRFLGHQQLGEATWPAAVSISALVLALLSAAFWLAGKLSMFAGRKLRERGIKLP